MLSAGFGAGAHALGYGALAPYASALGDWAGQKFKDITGYGDYTLRKNTLMGVPGVSNPNDIENAYVVSHKEYLGDVISASTPNTFALSAFSLNPGNPRTWEWLSQIACNFEQWVPQGIVFYYKSQSGSALNSVQTNLGTVLMATQYNIYADPFSSRAEMESYEFMTSGVPASDLVHGVECDPSQGAISTFFVDNGILGQSGPDRRFTDIGTFFVATDGFQGTSVPCGELWVTYQVALLKPKLFASLGRATDYFRYFNTTSAGGNPLGQNATGQLSTRTNMIVPFPTGSIHDPVGLLTGSGKYGTLQVSQSVGAIDILWPQYAFPTTYIVRYTVVQSATSVYTLAVTHNKGSSSKAPTARFYYGVSNGVTIAQHEIIFSVTIWGGDIIPSTDGVSANTELTGIPNTISTAFLSCDLEITQVSGWGPNDLY